MASTSARKRSIFLAHSGYSQKSSLEWFSRISVTPCAAAWGRQAWIESAARRIPSAGESSGRRAHERGHRHAAALQPADRPGQPHRPQEAAVAGERHPIRGGGLHAGGGVALGEVELPGRLLPAVEPGAGDEVEPLRFGNVAELAADQTDQVRGRRGVMRAEHGHRITAAAAVL